MKEWCAAHLAVLALLASAAAARGETLHSGGPPEDRIDLVFLAEGYEAGEAGEFREDARRVLEAMRTSPPYDRYMGLINVHTGFHPSADSGIGDPEQTRYGTAHYGGTLVRSSRMTTIMADAQAAAPEADYVLLICDDWRIGGTAMGTIGWATTSYQFTDIALHELGHMLANLADEYERSSRAASLTAHLQPGAPDHDARYRALLERLARGRANVTPHTERARIPWRAWIEPGQRIPARFWTRGVSAWEGAYYLSDDMYRPRRNCRMRKSSRSFCEPCREALVAAFHEQTRPSRVRVRAAGTDWVLRLESGLPREDVRIVWEGFAASGRELRLRRDQAPARVRVRVEDLTDWARLDDRSPLSQRLGVALGGGAATPPPTAGSAGAWPALGTVVGVSSRLRVRRGPGTSHPIVGHLGPGAGVLVTGPARGGWYPVRVGQTDGFASARYIDVGSGAGPGLVGALAR